MKITYQDNGFIFNCIFNCPQSITDSILNLGNCMVIRPCTLDTIINKELIKHYDHAL